LEKIICNGVPVHYRFRPAKVKSAGAPTLIFLHNAGTDHSIWSPVVDMLSDTYNLAQLDWPGYGNLRSDPKGHTLGYYADILSLFIAQHDLRSVVLVGNCLGSGASLEYCVRQKGQGIQAMILYNVLVPRTLGMVGRFFLYWSQSGLRDLYRKLRENLIVPRPCARLATRYQVKNMDCIPDPAKEHLTELYADPSNIRNLGALVESLSTSKHLDTLRMPAYFPPTMIIWGDKNRVLPLSCGSRFVRDFKPTEFHVESGGHLLMLEQPRICAGHIERFIRRTYA